MSPSGNPPYTCRATGRDSPPDHHRRPVARHGTPRHQTSLSFSVGLRCLWDHRSLRYSVSCPPVARVSAPLFALPASGRHLSSGWNMIDWLTFFADTIETIRVPLSTVLGASGCREGWLQGELYRAGHQYGLRVNEHSLGDRKTADLSCGDAPEMLAEIKIVGANYFPKMQAAIESDVERMRAVRTPGTQRFMILVIPRSDVKTKLGDYLDSCNFPGRCVEREWPEFRLRIWRLE